MIQQRLMQPSLIGPILHVLIMINGREKLAIIVIVLVVINLGFKPLEGLWDR